MLFILIVASNVDVTHPAGVGAWTVGLASIGGFLIFQTLFKLLTMANQALFCS